MATETTEAAGHAATELGACINDVGGAIGMPQLCVDWMPNQIFWLVVSLGVIYFVLSRVALPRIGGVLAERKGLITNDLTAAEELKAKSVEAEKIYLDALARARVEAARIVAEARLDIQKDLDAATAKADAAITAMSAESEGRIAEIRAGALEAVTAVAKDTARELVAALGGKADAAGVNAAVSARLKG